MEPIEWNYYTDFAPIGVNPHYFWWRKAGLPESSETRSREAVSRRPNRLARLRPRLTQIQGHRRGEAFRLSGYVAVATMLSDLSVGEKAFSPSLSSRDHDRTSSHNLHAALSFTLSEH